MQKEKICKFQSFASIGSPELGPKRLAALQNEITNKGPVSYTHLTLPTRS